MYIVASFQGGPLDGQENMAVRPDQNYLKTIQLVSLAGDTLVHTYVRHPKFGEVTEGLVPFLYEGSVPSQAGNE
jgi:hypothetical protein